MENKFDKQFEEFASGKHADKIRDLYADKTYTQRYKGIYTVFNIGSYVAQVVSILLAVFFPAYLCYILFGSWIVGFAMGGVVMILLDTLKRLTVTTGLRELYMGRGGKVALFFGAIFMGFSVVSSYMGTPIAVKHFGSEATLLQESTIQAKRDSMHAAITSRYDAAIANAKAEQQKVFKANSWKNKISRSARPQYLALSKQIERAQKNKLADIRRADQKLDEELQALQANNNITQEDHEAKTTKAAYIFSLCTLVFELFFGLALLFCVHYEYRLAMELNFRDKEVGDEHMQVAELTSPLKKEAIKEGEIRGNKIGVFLPSIGEVELKDRSYLQSRIAVAKRRHVKRLKTSGEDTETNRNELARYLALKEKLENNN